MALTVNQIERLIAYDGVSYTPHPDDVYRFDGLRGTQKLTETQLRVAGRDGVDGVELIDKGRRGQPFVLTSRVYLPDQAAALTALRAYQALAEVDLGVAITQLDLTLWPASVISVQPAQQVRPVARVTGSVLERVTGQTPTVELLCAWTLIYRDA